MHIPINIYLNKYFNRLDISFTSRLGFENTCTPTFKY